MEFSEWLSKTPLKREEIADKLGISRQAVYNIAQGARPKWEVAQKIKELSRGKVSTREWYK